MKNLTDEQLIKSYREGDDLAFNEIYIRYKNLVKYFSRNLYLLGAEQEDLMQEGMFGLIKAVNGYKEGETTFKTYLITCIKSSLFTAVKKYAGNKMSPLNKSLSLEKLDGLGLFAPPPDEQLAMESDGGELNKKLISVLSKTELAVLKLYLEGYRYSEIALKTNKNVKFVDNALARCRKKIIKSLGD